MLLHQTSPSCGPSPSTWPEVSIKHRRFAAAHRGLTGHACAVNTKDRQATNIEQDSLQRALKEWAVTCAALGQGDQTVPACVQLPSHLILSVANLSSFMRYLADLLKLKATALGDSA